MKPTDSAKTMVQLDAQHARRVREMIFADLYLGHPQLGHRLSEVPRAPTNPIVAGPELHDDLEALRAVCEQARSGAGNQPDFRVVYDDTTYRVAVLEAVGGVVFVLRRIPPAIPALHELGVPQVYARILMQKGLTGLILISGAMKSGKSTTAGTLLAERLVAYGGVAVTAEDPVEMPLEGAHGPGICFQTRADPASGGYAAAARKLMRWGSNIVLLGEIRDGESAVEVLRAGINGHLIIATLHADDIQTAIRRLEVLTCEHYAPSSAQALMADGLAMVLHQRLTGSAPRKLEAELLSVRGHSSAQAIIRGGNYLQLGSEIRQQTTNALSGRPLP